MFAAPVQRVIDELTRLPGIGRKSAQRLAFHLMGVEETDARRLAQSIIDMRTQVQACRRCFNVAADDECGICRDSRRDGSLVCVVERPQDIVVIERTQEFRGRYHVLGGSFSPIAGIGPDQLHIAELMERIADEGIQEVIMATNPTVEGDTTAMYLARELKPLGVQVTRLASGLPVGGDLDYADELTLGRALLGRREM
ncbi:recombination protein RecR [bacterium BMS3Abin02]|nr:recombination protein RecR [bacterium BMS3Abin02]GBE20973.1 recombination protein RecR [bacterium BMS3Bbin01]HDK46114.1 recombination protein RecR [Actinomycetota bacterium]HDL49871.1 recombination protein RecR [Actinomycetota bacterium]